MASTTFGADRAHRQSGHLLDDEELNIGSSQVAVVPLARPFPNTAVAPGKEIRLLDLQTESKNGRTVSVVLTQSIQETEDSPVANTSGPITGIVEFTTGAAGIIRIEFDIPSVSRFPTVSGLITSNPDVVNKTYPPALIAPALSGVALCVPASSLRVFTRNDNNIAQIWDPRRIVGSTGNDVDPTVNAAVCYGEVFGANKHLKKTIYIAEEGGGTIAMATGMSVYIGIPPFARSVRFPRLPIATTTLSIRFDTYFGSEYGDYAIPVNSDGPVEIPPGAYRILIIVTSAIAVNDLAAIFDLVI